MDYAGESSRTTHGNVEAVDACRYFAGLILGSILGKSKEEILSSMFSPVPGYWRAKPLCREVEQIAQGSFKDKAREGVKSGGYVIHSLEAALWAFYNSDNFTEGLIKAINLAGDADTVGAIYGQLAGAYYGEIAIPSNFVFTLKGYHLFFNFADEMVCFYAGKEVLNAFKD